MKKVFALVLVAVMLTGLLPMYASAEDTGFEEKTLSILGDSISTYTGVSNDETANATLKGGAIYYSTGRLGVYQSDTWWQQTIDALQLKLLVNNSWSGSCVLNERSGTVGAYLDRCVQLHNASGEDPDLIAVYLGTNDFWSFPDALGTADAIDYGELILAAEEGFTYATPKTTCEAYAIMLHKMKQRYPNAEIYCFTLLPRSNQSASKVQQLQAFNASVKQIANRFGAYTVDLYNNCGIKADENFQFYVADNALHPGPAGMDAITGCFASSLLKNSRYVGGTVYDVSYDLTDVIVDQGTATAALEGSDFSCSLTAPVNHILNVSVTMGDEDITAECYADGKIQISQVSGNIHIVARAELAPKDPQNYRWECKDDQLVSVSESGNTINHLTMTQGSITDGKFSNVKYTIEEAIVLKHDLPWIVEWVSEGTWTDTTDGALLLAGAASSTTADTPYLYRRHNSDFIAFGYASGGRYYNYGVSLSTHGIDGTAKHTYRLTNRIAEDGSNMVYLSVDGQELAAMNHHWIGGTDQKKTVDWLNGKDLTFTHMGTSPHTIGNCYIDYVQVWENGHAHSYENGICTGCGDPDPEYPRNYRWECKDDQLVSISEFGNTHNRLTMTQGGITDGKFSNVKCTIEEAIVLKHELPWSIQWTSEGTWTDTTDGALLFAGAASSSTADTPYLYRRHNSDFIAFGYASGGKYYNYGVSLSAHGVDGTAKHTYRLTNRISEDGSNMVYLSVDGQELAAMNHHWIGGTDQKKTVDWLNGKDLTFTHMGTSPHTIGNCYIDYVQVWENGHDHSYSASVTAPTCTEQGYTTYTCTCGDRYVSDYVGATGNHTYENGSCTGCGKGSPALTLQSPTLEFKDMICIVAFYTAENMEDAVEMGMITYKNQVTEWSVETADYVIPGASLDAATGRYYSVSQGIHAKYLADTVYLACYAKLKDGGYIYTKLAPYSPITYATNQLKNSTDGKLKQLVAAMLNYGSAAQQYFGYHTDDLANDGMTEEQQFLPEDYRPDMVSTVAAVSAAKQGSFANNSGFLRRYPAVSFEGAFCINYFFAPLYAPADGITMYYWNETDFAATEVLTAENATGFVTLACNETGEYRGDITGVAAKSLSEAVYVAAAYQDSNGSVWTSGVLGYSIGAYCVSQVAKGGDIATLAMATAVYGYHAKQYFG